LAKLASGQPIFDPTLKETSKLHPTKICPLSHDLQEEGKGVQDLPPGG
jgi:hypothetical protein